MYCVQKKNGVFWYRDSSHTIMHRIGGPAAIFDSGKKVWIVNDKRHRDDGPALTWADGTYDWYLDGIYYQAFEDYIKELKKTKSPKEILMLKLKYS